MEKVSFQRTNLLAAVRIHIEKTRDGITLDDVPMRRHGLIKGNGSAFGITWGSKSQRFWDGRSTSGNERICVGKNWVQCWRLVRR
jgi:hypothetical protein